MGTSSPRANLVVMAGAIHAAALLDLKFGRSLIVNPRTLMESSKLGPRSRRWTKRIAASPRG